MRTGRLRVSLDVGTVLGCRADALVRCAPGTLVARRDDDLLAAAGPAVSAACRELRARVFPRGMPAGAAVTTGAGSLPATWLVHVVVPRFTVSEDRGHLLAAAYRAVLHEADGVGATTVAMPALGTTAPYWPLADAARIAVSTLASTPTQVRELRLMVSTAAGLEVFAEAMARDGG